MSDIVIIDYGMGNLRSVQHAFSNQGYATQITDDREKIRNAAGLVLPGVGAFGRAMDNLNRLGLADILRERLREGIPFLGICLGLQLLFEASEEAPGVKGLSVFEGGVERFVGDFKIPSIGWNNLAVKRANPLLVGVDDKTFFYFVHSYFVRPKQKDSVLAVSSYGVEFPAMVGSDRCFGLQFHPEKSSLEGLKIIGNFGKMVREDGHYTRNRPASG